MNAIRKIFILVYFTTIIIALSSCNQLQQQKATTTIDSTTAWAMLSFEKRTALTPY